MHFVFLPVKILKFFFFTAPSFSPPCFTVCLGFFLFLSFLHSLLPFTYLLLFHHVPIFHQCLALPALGAGFMCLWESSMEGNFLLSSELAPLWSSVIMAGTISPSSSSLRLLNLFFLSSLVAYSCTVRKS